MFLFYQLTNHEVMNELFSNITWSGTSKLEVDDAIIVSHWSTTYTNIYVNLTIFIIMNVSYIFVVCFLLTFNFLHLCFVINLVLVQFSLLLQQFVPLFQSLQEYLYLFFELVIIISVF